MNREFKQCCSSKKYNERYDAYFCSFCDVWIEEKCSDMDCEFCKDRPFRPSEIVYFNAKSDDFEL